jgi:hypothetical protein
VILLFDNLNNERRQKMGKWASTNNNFVFGAVFLLMFAVLMIATFIKNPPVDPNEIDALYKQYLEQSTEKGEVQTQKTPKGTKAKIDDKKRSPSIIYQHLEALTAQ